MEFPRLVFKDNGPHQRPYGTYDYILVEDQAEFDASIVAGWSETMPYGLATVATQEGSQDLEEAPPTRAELEAKATELGLAFSPNIGDVKLGQRIQSALDAQKGEGV